MSVLKKIIISIFICFTVTGIVFAQKLIPQTGQNSIGKIVFRPDGKIFATFSYILSSDDFISFDYTIKLWDYETLTEMGTLRGHTRFINNIDFSPDGNFLLSCSSDNTLRIWDIATQKEIQNIKFKDVKTAVFGANTKRIVIVTKNNDIKILNLENNKEIMSLNIGAENIKTLLYDPQLQYIIFSDSKYIKILDTRTALVEKIFYGHKDDVYSIAVSPNKKFIVSGCEDGVIGVWDLYGNDSFMLDAGHTKEISTVGISNDNKFIFSYSSAEIALWDISQRKKTLSIPDNDDDIRIYAVLTPDSKKIITGLLSLKEKKILILRNVSDGKEIANVKTNYDKVTSISYNNAEKIIASSSRNQIVKLWNLTDGKMFKLLQDHSNSVNTVNFSPDGEKLLEGTNNRIYIWDWKNNVKLMSFYAHSASKILSAEYSSDGKNIISSGNKDNTIKLWDAKNGSRIWAKKHHGEDSNIKIVFSNNGQFTASAYESIQIRNVKTGALVKELFMSKDDKNERIKSLVFSNDDKYIFSGTSKNRKIIMWDIETGNQIKTFSEHESDINTLCVSRDGKMLASGSDDNNIILWNIEDGSFIKLTGHDDSVEGVCFTSNGKALISASADGSVRVWDCKTGNEIIKFIGFSDNEWVCITPDGYYNGSNAVINGNKYLAAVSGMTLFNMSEYKKRFYNPGIIIERLKVIN